MSEQYTDNGAMGWDDEISNDSDFIVVPAGEYDYTVKAYERARHTPTRPDAKLPACNKAVIHIAIVDPQTGREVMLKENLFMHRNCEGIICAFFTSIGQRKRGEKLAMNWPQVPGSRGRCKVGIRTWTKSDGAEGKVNEVTRFLEPAQPEQQSPGFTTGSF